MAVSRYPAAESVLCMKSHCSDLAPCRTLDISLCWSLRRCGASSTPHSPRLKCNLLFDRTASWGGNDTIKTGLGSLFVTLYANTRLGLEGDVLNILVTLIHKSF